MSTSAAVSGTDYSHLVIRLIEAGHGHDAVHSLERAVQELTSTPEADSTGFELSDLLSHLRKRGQEALASHVEEAAAYLLVYGAPESAAPASSTDAVAQARHVFRGSEEKPVFRRMWPSADDLNTAAIPERPTVAPRYAGELPPIVRHGYADDDGALLAESNKVQWFHSHDFGGDLRTEGVKPRQTLLNEADRIFCIDVRGRSVLDIGAWDGFFSVEASLRGASRVLSTDHFCWVGEGWGRKAGFDLAKRVLAPTLEERIADLPDLTPETVGQFDVVLFLGVLYHLKHPLYELERLSRLCDEVMIVETQMDLLDVDRPAMAFYPTTELNGDPTNWWAPNVPAMVDMLRTVGFQEIYYTENPASPSRGIFHAFR